MQPKDATENMPDKKATANHSISSILIVDKDQDAVRLLRETFQEETGKIDTATSGKQARELLEGAGFGYDVVLLELDLEDTRGEDFLEWIKLNSPSIAVIVISAEKSDDLLIRCLSKGASDFIEKPINPVAIASSVHLAFRRRSHQESLGEMQAELHASDWIELTANTEIEYLGRIQRFSEVLFSRRLPQKVVEDLRLAMEEFGRNAVEWGNKFSREKRFRINYCFFPDRVVLKFEDEGEGFNPTSVPDPSKDPIAHLKRRQTEGKRPGGFGIFMMKRIMDEIFYNERGNICIMTKYLPKGEGKKK